MLGLGDGEALQVVSKMAFHCTLIGFNVSRQDARTQRTIANDSLRRGGLALIFCATFVATASGWLGMIFEIGLRFRDSKHATFAQ